MSELKLSSFKFTSKDERKIINIPGTKVVSLKDQILLSSGVLSLDPLFGGGLQVGSILLIEEDEFGVFSKYLVKYFLAEGLACKHCLYVASLDCDVRQLVQELPSPVDYTETSRSSANDKGDLKIAWRYQDTPQVQSAPSSTMGSTVFGRHFDLTSPCSKDTLDNAEITYWPLSWPLCEDCTDPYTTILLHLRSHIQRQGHSSRGASQPRRTVLRVGLHRLGSPLWPQADARLPRFLYCLRQIIHSAHATAVITLPSALLQSSTVQQCEHLSDNVIRLQSLANNPSPAFSEYSGLLQLIKLATINTLAAHTPDTLDWAFKLRKKKFVVEKLHLPPELQDSTQREQDESSGLTCGSTKKSALDF